MRLCDTDIERHLDEGKIVIEPRPGVERISGVSVDVLLGNEFRVFRDHTAPYIDLGGTSAEMADAIERVMSEEIHVPDGEAFYLHPGQLALAVTYESVTLPADIVGWLDGRSSLARLASWCTSPPTASIRAGPVASCWSFTTAASCLWPCVPR